MRTVRVTEMRMHVEVLERVGRYEIVGELGAGSMSRVYLARDPNLDRQVAVKVVLRGVTLDNKEQSELERRFLLEARAAGKLSHPGIVRVYDADNDPALGIPYIAMEWVQGRSLRNLLDEGGRLDAVRTLDILSQVATALDYAHRAGRIHRDIKPSNILISTDGTAKVSDFGVAKIVSETHTVSGQILGTPAYMSPEQVKDDPLDGRSDLFSLGAVLYQCISGRTPFSGESLVQVVYKILNVDPRPLDLAPTGPFQELAMVTSRALQKDPNSRFQTGAEFALALDRVRSALAAGAVTIFPPSATTDEDVHATTPGLGVHSIDPKGAGRNTAGTQTRTVQLGTTSIHRAISPAPPQNAPSGRGLHDTIVTTTDASTATGRRRLQALGVGLLLAGLLVIALWALGNSDPTAAGPPLEIVAWERLSTPTVNPSAGRLSFPLQPEPTPQSTSIPDGNRATLQRRMSEESEIETAAPLAVQSETPQPAVEAPQELTSDPPLPPTVLTPVTIIYKHRGGAAFLSIALDGQRVWSEELSPVEGRLQRLSGYTKRAVIPVPSGTHTLQFGLTDPDRGVDASGSIRSRYTKGAPRTLRVSVDPGNNSLQLRWKE